MDIVLKEITIDDIDEYSNIPIKFEVEKIFDVKLIDDGLGGIELVEKKLDKSYIKDYDKDSDLRNLEDEFEITNWGFFLAYIDKRPVGGVIIAYDTEGVNMLSGRDDLAAVWDIRVRPEFRGKGVGHKLFQKAVQWAKERHCKLLKVETQNINIPACKFYFKEGCRLGNIDRYAYSEEENLSHETMLIWYLELE
ncbi:MAG: GNAT family N-acetyltransferase [Candidatus Saliniplasma sp.]